MHRHRFPVVVHFHWLLADLLVLAVLANWPVAAAAAPSKSTFRAGDKVILEVAGKERPATIQSIDSRSGWLRVKYDDARGGEEQRPPSQFRSASAPKTKPASSGGDDAANPFETAEERASRAAPRTWVDASGKHKIEGTFVKIEGADVTIKRADGKVITLPIEKFSDDDRAYIKSLLGGGMADATGKPPEAGEESAAAESPETNSIGVDATSAPPVEIDPAAAWTYEPDPLAKAAKLPAARVMLGKKDFFEKANKILFAPEAGKAIVVFLQTFQNKRSRVVFCDLKGGKVESSGDFVPNLTPLAMSEDMKRIAATSIDEGWGKRDTVSLYEAQGKKPKLICSWQPYGQGHSHKEDIESAEFVDANHLLTVSSDGWLVCWDLSDGNVKPSYQILKVHSKRPALSGTNKYLAAAVDGGIAVIEAISGKQAGFFPLKRGGFPSLAFHPKGEQLAVQTFNRTRICDLTTQNLSQDFTTTAGSLDRLDWANDASLVLGGKYVIDVPHRVHVWTFDKVLCGEFGGGRFWSVSEPGRDQTMLSAGIVPPAEMTQALAKLKPDDLLVVKPGMDIALDVDLGQFQLHREKVIQALKEQLAAYGMKVVEGSPLKLVVRVRSGPAQTITTRQFGRIGRENHTVTPQETSLSYQLNGKEIWTTGGSQNVPRLIETKSGETIEQAVLRSQAESISKMGGIELPPLIAILPEGMRPGVSPAPSAK